MTYKLIFFNVQSEKQTIEINLCIDNQIREVYNNINERIITSLNRDILRDEIQLYGSSNDITALGYDEVTDQLHVGTSSGRSDFQGLCRINNTTTAVTTAISAHDEFIIEQ